MQFKIPNVVVVFSNHMPITRALSKDRWKIFRIVNAGLKDITIQVWKHRDKTFESNLKKKTMTMTMMMMMMMLMKMMNAMKMKTMTTI